MKQLLRQVAQRQRLVLWGSRFHLYLLVGTAVCWLAVLVVRLTGLVPSGLAPWTLLAAPALAILLALIFTPAAESDAAARKVDAHLKTKDLFLTASGIEHSLGQYQPMVLAQAEESSVGVKAAEVVKFRWQRSALEILGMMALLAVTVVWLPSMDPFGRAKLRKQFTEQEQVLERTRKATVARTELLEKKTEGEHTEQIKAVVEEMKKTFQGATPSDKTGTLAKLNDEQKELGQLWKQLGEEKTKETLQRAASSQGLGMMNPEKMQQMKSDMAKGDLGSAVKEINELKALAEKLAAATDTVEQEKVRQELANRLQDLRETMGQQMNSQPMDSALQRAMEQLQMANQKDLSEEAMKAVGESLKLSAEEMKQLAQAAHDMQSVEDALKAMQAAKRLNNAKGMDGKEAGDKNMEEYAAMFNKMYEEVMGQQAGNAQGDQPGQGMGPGQGQGKRPTGDGKQATDFKDEKSVSQMQPGKMLLEWKTHEVGEAGHAAEEYLRAVSDIKQQASEAVLQEQIPPGYHAAIKSYFNTLSDDLPKPVKP